MLRWKNIELVKNKISTLNFSSSLNSEQNDDKTEAKNRYRRLIEHDVFEEKISLTDVYEKNSNFFKYKEEFKQQINFNGTLYRYVNIYISIMGPTLRQTCILIFNTYLCDKNMTIQLYSYAKNWYVYAKI